MALIKCPECGREISDKAKACPHCGCPIESSSSAVRIRLPRPIRKHGGIDGLQDVTISGPSGVLFEGTTDMVAELVVDGPTNITINYHSNHVSHLAGKCSGVIDPAVSMNYVAFAERSPFKTKLELRVDNEA